tara:strand:- start:95 stop:598 length:504 start_codon:yes stop_codon:yes gene_type:complete
MGFTAAGIATDTVSTTQLAPLGFVLTAPCATADAGYCEWVYVFNDEATTAFAVGNTIFRDPSLTTQDWYGGLITPVDDHQPTVTVLGVAQHVIAAGSYGFILQKGVGTILAGNANLTVDAAITTGGATTAGTAIVFADDATATIAVIGHVATQILANTTGLAYINCG